MILAGTNDIAGNTGPMTDETIEGNLASMSELAAANDIKVVLASITPVSEYSPRQSQRDPADEPAADGRIHAINEWMQVVRRERTGTSISITFPR